MQSYSNFTVGGSLSVNSHGRYIGEGAIVKSVLELNIVLSDGTIKFTSPTKNEDIFYSSIGGYGGIGVISNVKIQLTDNVKIKLHSQKSSTKEYFTSFNKIIKNNSDIIFHNGLLYPPEYETIRSVSWIKTDDELTLKERLTDKNKEYY